MAVARVEMLAPFQTGALREVIDGYSNLKEIVWVQEEPRNMGAWSYMGYRLRDLVEDRIPVRYIERSEQASPAEGYAESIRKIRRASSLQHSRMYYQQIPWSDPVRIPMVARIAATGSAKMFP